MNGLTDWGIRTRVLLVAVLPVVISTVLLGYYLVNARLNDAEEALNKQGDRLLKHLASGTEFGLFARNLDLLQSVVDGVVRDPEVVWAAVLDGNRKPVVSAGKEPRADADPVAFHRYEAPIRRTQLTVLDYPQEQGAPTENQPIGWVQVVVSGEAAQELQERIIRGSLVLIVLGLLGSALVGLTFGRSVTTPLVRLSDMVNQLGNGDLDARVSEGSTGELGVLERGFNTMASTLQRNQTRLEEEVSLSTERLRHTVTELSRKNQALQEAQELALAAGREKSEFLARMSHEIRTPLNAVVGFSRLLGEPEAAARQAEYVRTIDQASTQLLNVIDGVLNYTRLESGTVTLERVAFDLPRCLEDGVAMLSPAAHEKGLELVLLLPADLPVYVEGDPGRINQVLMNLINNAIKFTPTGHVLVQAARQTDPPRIRVTVSDTGVGLTADEQGRLFQAFSQADGSVTRRFGGTGLGLAISRQLVTLMGGEIDLESVKGQGSAFRFSFPCHQVASPAALDRFTALAGCRALIYESHPLVRRALRANLLGWHVELFNSGSLEQVTEIARGGVTGGQPFDLLVVGLSRDECEEPVLQELHASLRAVFPGPILLLVGATTWRPPAFLRTDEAIAWVSKPARRETLYQEACRLLARGDQEAQARSGGADRPAGAVDLTGRAVLVAEDNAFNRALMRTHLETRGARVEEVTDGEQVLRAVAARRYDLIFMDLHMPVLDGLAATRRLRAQSAGRQRPPIIAFTADVMSDGQAPAKPDGPDDYLYKPVTPEALDAVLTRWCTGAARTAATPTLPASLYAQLGPALAELVAEIRAAVTVLDRRAIAEGAHQLKGLCGYYALTRLGQRARELEQQGATATAAELEATLSRFTAELDEVLPLAMAGAPLKP